MASVGGKCLEVVSDPNQFQCNQTGPKYCTKTHTKMDSLYFMTTVFDKFTNILLVLLLEIALNVLLLRCYRNNQILLYVFDKENVP